jgi:hypothetical protein
MKNVTDMITLGKIAMACFLGVAIILLVVVKILIG